MNKYLKDEVSKMPKEILVEYADFLDKSFWTHQGHWMLNINNRYGTEAAAEFDELVFGRSAEVQVHRLKKLFGLGDAIADLIRALTLTTVWSNVDYVWLDVSEKTARLRITHCIMQKNRLELGLPELPCKKTGFKANELAARVINPKIKTTCIVCPPDQHEEDRWCEWLFELEV